MKPVTSNRTTVSLWKIKSVCKGWAENPLPLLINYSNSPSGLLNVYLQLRALLFWTYLVLSSWVSLFDICFESHQHQRKGEDQQIQSSRVQKVDNGLSNLSTIQKEDGREVEVV